MMRGLHQATVAVRAPDGSLKWQDRELNAVRRKRWSNIPILRGVQMLGDALMIGVWALLFAGNTASGEDEQPLTEGQTAGLITSSLVFAIALFFVTPLVLASGAARFFPLGVLGREVLEGALRLGIFVGYLLLIRRSRDIQRVFMYHGAEHKTVNAYEAGAPLTIDHVRHFGLIHPRCGTSFVLVVLLLSIVLFTLLGDLPFWLRLVSRIVGVPFIAGVGYELLRLQARNYEKRWVRALVAPTLAMQKLTTAEPDESQLEVAIMALSRVLLADGVNLEQDPHQPNSLVVPI
jgi:uncharacterized protein YqhQ